MAAEQTAPTRDEGGRGGRRAGIPQAIVLTLATYLPVLAIVSLAPDIPQLIQQFHAEPNVGVMVPLILTTPGLCIAALSPFVGALVDRLGRRRIMLFALVLYAFAGLAPLVLNDLKQIIGSRVALGVAEAILMTAGNALIGDYYHGAERRKWLAIQSALGALLSTGLWFAGGLLAENGWRGPFAIYSVAIPIFLAALIWMFEPKKPDFVDVDAPGALADKARFPLAWLIMVCAVTLVTTTIYFVYTLNAGLLFSQLGVKSPKNIGLITSVVALGVPIAAAIYGKISGVRVNYLLALIFGFLGAGLLGLAFSPDWRIGVIPAFIQQLGSGMTVPVLVAWAQSRLPFEHRGRGMGMWLTCFFVGQFTTPFAIAAIGTFTTGLSQTVAVIGVVSLAMAVGALALAVLVRRGDAAPVEQTA